MSRESSTTKPVTFRITREQAALLEKLPPSISSAALVRTLLKFYFEGRIPLVEAYLLAEQESQERESAA